MIRMEIDETETRHQKKKRVNYQKVGSLKRSTTLTHL